MKDAFDVLMITHAGLCKGYADALKLILDIDEDDFGTLSFENGESLDDFSEAINVYTLKEYINEQGSIINPDGGELADYAKLYETIDEVIIKLANKLKYNKI